MGSGAKDQLLAAKDEVIQLQKQLVEVSHRPRVASFEKYWL